MSCRRALEIDLADFLAEPVLAEFAEFRVHYPGCAECSAEVRAWTEVVALLRESAPSGNGAHPEPALLLRYEERDAALPAAQRTEIERHLASCATCREELLSLRSFPFEVLAVRPADPPRHETIAWLSRLRALVLHPAFAYALVALLLWPAGLTLMSGRVQEREPPSDLALALERVPPEAGQPLARIAPPARQVAELQVVEPSIVAAAERQRRAALPVEIEEVRKLEPGAAAYAAAAGVEATAEERRPLEPEPFAARTELAASPAPAPALRFVVPVGLRRSDAIEVRVRDRLGTRELRERVRAPWQSPLTIRLPADWPPGTRYSVELRALGEEGPRDPPVRVEAEP
jgi:hypothetical protein